MANKTEILAATNEIETAFTTFKNSKSEIPSLINHNEKIKMGDSMDIKQLGASIKKANFLYRRGFDQNHFTWEAFEDWLELQKEAISLLAVLIEGKIWLLAKDRKRYTL